MKLVIHIGSIALLLLSMCRVTAREIQDRFLVYGSQVKIPLDSGRLTHSRHFNSSGDENKLFIGVGFIDEQLSKARIHLSNIMALAKSHGRTLILPLCGESKISSSSYCKLPLSTYFDLDTIGEFVNWVTEDYYFKHFSKSTLQKPFFLYIDLKCNASLSSDRFKPFVENAVYSAHATNQSNSTLQGDHACIRCQKRQKRLNLELASQSPLILVSKTSTQDCFRGILSKLALAHIQYPKALQRKSQEFAGKILGDRFLAIQWRIEYSVRRGLDWLGVARCIEGLVHTAKVMIQEQNLTAVFLATDSRHASSSVSWLGRDKMGWLENVTSSIESKLEPHKWQEFDPEFYSLDSGVRGILDKFACARSVVFLYPPPACFKTVRDHVPSSYTREIIGMRSDTSLEYGTPSGAVTQPWKLLD